MFARSIRKPLVGSLGTGIVLIVALAPPVLAGPTASPAETVTPSTMPSSTPTGAASTPAVPPTPTPPPPVLSVSIAHAPSVGNPGSNYPLDVTVTVKSGPATGVVLTVGSSKATVTCVANQKRVYTIGSLAGPRLVAITVAVPGNVTSGTVSVWAHVDGDGKAVKGDTSVSFTVKKTKPTASATPKSSSPGGAGSSGGSNTAPVPPAGTSTGGTSTGGPAPSTAPDNGATLPGIPSDQPPSTVPLVANAGNTQSMRGTNELPDQLTFEKLASTQAAWLAALLVAFSLLLTQVRLGRANARPDRASPAAPGRRPRGTHRRNGDRIRRFQAR